MNPWRVSWFATETNVEIIVDVQIGRSWPLSISLSGPPISRALLVIIYIARYICCMGHVLVDRRRRNIECLIITWHRIAWSRRARGRLQPVHFREGRRSLGPKRILWNITLAVMARTRAERIPTATKFRQMMVYPCEWMHLRIIGWIRWMSVLLSSSNWRNLGRHRRAIIKKDVRSMIHFAIDLLRTCRKNEDHTEHF